MESKTFKAMDCSATKATGTILTMYAFNRIIYTTQVTTNTVKELNKFIANLNRRMKMRKRRKTRLKRRGGKYRY